MDEVVRAAPTEELDAKWGSGYVIANAFTKMVLTSMVVTRCYGTATGSRLVKTLRDTACNDAADSQAE